MWCNKQLFDKSNIFKFGIKFKILVSTAYILLFDKLNISNEFKIFFCENNLWFKLTFEI